MNLKKNIKNFFKYTPEKNYDFNIIENTNKTNIESKSIIDNSNKKINSSINSNLEIIQTTYNTLINSDIIIRKFTLNARNKQYNAFLLYIDGMIDSNLLNDFILKPLMLKNKSNSFSGNENRVISESIKNNVKIRKVKKFDISEYILNSLMPQNNIKQQDTFEKIISGVNSGNCALFIDTLNIAYDIDIKGFKQRNIDSPNNEVVIKGSQEAFVENIRTNTSILRRLINNENLIIENIEVGKITKTKCCVCYMKNITNSDLVAEAKYRLNNIAVDSILSLRRT